jgi:maltose O-acetyltransferase
MKERMLRGEEYLAGDPELVADRARAEELLTRYNATAPGEHDALLRELLGEVGEGVVVRAPFFCDYGSYISIGAETFLNYDCVLLDVAPIRIGAFCQIASAVQILTPTHPIDPKRRREGWEAAEPITIGENVWLGGGVIVCPGVTIGDDTVVGRGRRRHARPARGRRRLRQPGSGAAGALTRGRRRRRVEPRRKARRPRR